MTPQLADCRAEAARRGWVIAEEDVETTCLRRRCAKRRPAYERMLTDIAEGRRDAVLVWHLDRLHRHPIQLVRFVETCQQAGVRDVGTLSDTLDLANGDALLTARLMAIVARHEIDTKSRRTARKTLEIAQTGRPTKGGPRPFGFTEATGHGVLRRPS